MNRLLVVCLTIVLVGCASKGTKQGEKEAERDLAKGQPQVYIAGLPVPERPAIDEEFGLPEHNFGCLVDRQLQDRMDAYNRTVRKWIGANGLPPNSLKPRFVERRTALAALEKGKSIPEAGVEVAPDGRRAEYAASTLSIFMPNAENPSYRHKWVKGQPIVAWGDGSSVFLQLTWDFHESKVRKYHVDLEHETVIQEFRD
jgi:hypothetical protein